VSAARELIEGLRSSGKTVACAESLTGGALTAALVEIPGASAVVRGGIVAYATELKHDLLGVDAALLGEFGPIHGDVAAAMAMGVREKCGADVGIATTGVAGPDGQDGHPPGEVYIAVAHGVGVEIRGLRLTGDRAAIRAASVIGALELAVGVVREDASETLSDS
jgi:nicotinamide-nucleotide amidase